MIGVRHRNVSCSTIESRYYDDKYLLRGICKKCHTNETYKNTTLCLVCLIDQREKQKKYRKNRTQEQKEKANKNSKRRVDLCIAFGVCRNCQKRDVQKPHTYCSICLAKRRNRRKSKLENQGILSRELRTELGLCSVCGKNLAMKDKKVCSECYPAKLKAMNKCRAITAETGNANHIWRKLNKGIKRNN